MRERIFTFVLVLILHFFNYSTAATCYSSVSTDESPDDGFKQCSGACCVKVMLQRRAFYSIRRWYYTFFDFDYGFSLRFSSM